MEYTFEMLSEPIAKKRPRFSKHGTYDIQGAERSACMCELLPQMRQKGIYKPLEGPLEIDLTFHTKIPESFSKRKRMALEGMFNLKRPDIDNYLKWTFDILNTFLYHDDAQIVKISASKIYSLEPKTIFTVKTIEVP